MIGGIEDAAHHRPGFRLDPVLAAELGAEPEVPLPGRDEDGFTLLWESLRGLRGAGEDSVETMLVGAPDSHLHGRALVAHAVATGVLADPERVVPLAGDTGAADLIALATGLTPHPATAVPSGAGQPGAVIAAVADAALPVEPGAAPSSTGSVALRFGEPLVAEVTAVAARSELTFDAWPLDPGDGQGDPRFVEETLVEPLGTALLDTLLKQAGTAPGELAEVVLTCGVRLRPGRWAKRWNVAAVSQADDGAAAGLAVVLDRLAAHGPGSTVALLDLGWGGSGVLLRAGDRAGNHAARPASERTTYGYRAWTRAVGASRTAGPWTSPAELRREMPDLLGLVGGRCGRCSAVGFPLAGVCELCGSFEVARHPLRRTGTVATHSIDHLFAAPDGPVQMVVVDLDGGGRFYGQAVADLARPLDIGDRARLVLRRLHTARGLPHYFWKVDSDDQG